MSYLVDTTVWIEVERGRLRWERIAEITGSAPVFVSPVTLAELKYGAECARDRNTRARRLAGVEAILRKPILPIEAAPGSSSATSLPSSRSRGGATSFACRTCGWAPRLSSTA